MDSALPHIPAYLSHLSPGTLLPTAWNTKEKFNHIEVSQQNLQAAYKGPGKTDADAAAIRANHPIPSACGIYYFEAEVISKGRDGYMGIGLCWDNVAMSRLPGWEPNSYGYHADDGHSFNQTGTGRNYGPTYTTGDVVGCGINFIDNTIFYTKNGVHLGTAFRDVKGVFYPTVGMRTPGEVMLANFGQRPFRFDIEAYVKEERAKLQATIDAQSLGPDNGILTLNRLILSYLIHQGYGDTAAALARAANLLPAGAGGSTDDEDRIQVDGEPPAAAAAAAAGPETAELVQQLSAIKERQAIHAAIVRGDIPGAMALLERSYPNLLDRNPNAFSLVFQLKCQQFVELVRQMVQEPATADKRLAETMQFGQQLQDTYSGRLTDAQQAQLEETFSLLAYPDPFRSPVAHLLEPAKREDVAAAANSAVLGGRRAVYQHYPAVPPLERTMRQLLVVFDELVAQGVGAAAFLNVRSEFL